jgi:hypothetical protein
VPTYTYIYCFTYINTLLIHLITRTGTFRYIHIKHENVQSRLILFVILALVHIGTYVYDYFLDLQIGATYVCIDVGMYITESSFLNKYLTGTT